MSFSFSFSYQNIQLSRKVNKEKFSLEVSCERRLEAIQEETRYSILNAGGISFKVSSKKRNENFSVISINVMTDRGSKNKRPESSILSEKQNPE